MPKKTNVPAPMEILLAQEKRRGALMGALGIASTGTVGVGVGVVTGTFADGALSTAATGAALSFRSVLKKSEAFRSK